MAILPCHPGRMRETRVRITALEIGRSLAISAAWDDEKASGSRNRLPSSFAAETAVPCAFYGRSLIAAATEHDWTSRWPSSAPSDSPGTSDLTFDMRWIAGVLDFACSGDRSFQRITHCNPSFARARHRDLCIVRLQGIGEQIARAGHIGDQLVNSTVDRDFCRTGCLEEKFRSFHLMGDELRRAT